MDTAVQVWWARTRRLRLRCFTSSDHGRLLTMHRDPRMRALLVDDFPLDQPDCAWEFLAGLKRIEALHQGLGIWHTERWQAPDPTALADAQAAVDAGEIDAAALDWLRGGSWAFCGWFNLMPMPDESGRVEIGCRLLPSAWGTGLVLEGGEALLARAFAARLPGQARGDAAADTPLPGLGLGEVWAVCHPQHRSVHAVLHSLGFVPQGIGPYGGAAAAHYRVSARDWSLAQQQPRRLRQRLASQALRELAA